MALAMVVGEVELSPSEVYDALIGRLPSGTRASGDAVIWSLRVPRALAGIVIGGGLGISGAALQAFHRNQMADPYLLGISSAAGVGAVVGVLIGTGVGNPLVVTIIAAGMGALFAMIIRRIAHTEVDAARLVLVGLTLGIALLAWTVIIVFVADTPRLPTFTYFIFGSLGAVTWASLWPAAVGVAAAASILAVQWRTLDLFALGESEAHHLGVDVSRFAAITLGSVGVATGATVALGGVIGFVGLLAPLAASRVVGASIRLRLPSAALVGATFVLLADVVSRAIAGPVEVPIGIVTASIGGPVLVWLITTRKQST